MAAGETAGKVDIDHHSPVPKYSQLREILLDLIETELDRSTQPIPSERELSPAVRAVPDDRPAGGGPPGLRGPALPGPGQGHVRGPAEDRDAAAAGLVHRGHARPRAGARLPRPRPPDRQGQRPPGPDAADRAGRRGARHRAAADRRRDPDGGRALAHPGAVAPGLSDTPLGRRVAVRRAGDSTYGVRSTAASRPSRPASPTRPTPRLLDLPAGAAAVLLLQRRSFVGDRPVEFAVSTYRADRYQLHVALEVPRGGR